jgi:ribosome-binding factor A
MDTLYTGISNDDFINKIYPEKELLELGNKDLLFESRDSSIQKITTSISHISLMKDLVYSKKYTYIMVGVSADIRFAKSASTDYASFLFSLIDSTNQKRNFN